MIIHYKKPRENLWHLADIKFFHQLLVMVYLMTFFVREYLLVSISTG
jgi:hypothetical protein